MILRRSKIVATLGPASSDDATLARLLQAGADVIRLNLSHGNQDDHRRMIHAVRRISAEQGRFVPVFMDLMGPRFRLGTIEDGPRPLQAGDMVHLGDKASGADLPIEDTSFLSHMRRGERILIDNGLLELVVEAKHAESVKARVVTGGDVSTRKGINLPDTDLPFSISDKDASDIDFAVAEGVDYLAVSFVGGPSDLRAVRKRVQQAGGNQPLIAKLERATVTQRIAETVAETDAVMVARGDLGVEVPLHEVPILQKKIIEAGRQQGKPVIVATQMLESMMDHPRPTRAESTDVANAVFDGTDALMLSGETAAGKYPVEAVTTMARIIREAEAYMNAPSANTRRNDDDYLDRFQGPLTPNAEEQRRLTARDKHLHIPEVVAAASVFAGNRMKLRQIVAFSQGGFTARMIARYRPRTPILVFTRDEGTARRINLVWGVRTLLLTEEVEHHDEVVRLVDKRLLAERMADPDDVIMIMMGDPVKERPLTNLMRVHRVRAEGN
ncbi:MAG: pyruvate kinase [Acidobacteriota bacterium]